MNKLKLLFVAFAISAGLASCSSSAKSISHQGKFNPCAFSAIKKEPFALINRMKIALLSIIISEMH